MNAMLKTQAQFRPMQLDDLDEIMLIEPQIYPYPWTLGNVSDSLTSCYSAWVLVEHEKIIA